MGSILSLISGALSVVANWLGFQSKRLDLKNAPDVRQAEINQKETDAVAKTDKAIAGRDAAEVRRELAE